MLDMLYWKNNVKILTWMMRKFSMARDESSTLWISREKAASTSRKLYKSPEFVYEECSGCGHVFKPSHEFSTLICFRLLQQEPWVSLTSFLQ
jgi:hypothetical protein